MFRRIILGITLVIASVGTVQVASGGAAFAGQRWGCYAWVTSNGRPGGGVSGFCEYGPSSAPYRVVGLCKNNFTQSSRWIYGPWLTSGQSFAGCSWYETPQPYPFMQS